VKSSQDKPYYFIISFGKWKISFLLRFYGSEPRLIISSNSKEGWKMTVWLGAEEEKKMDFGGCIISIFLSLTYKVLHDLVPGFLCP
jgi:hypothetical protein